MKALTRCQAYMKVYLRDVGNIIDESDQAGVASVDVFFVRV